MSIKPADLKTKIFIPRYYSDPTGAHPGPALRCGHPSRIATAEDKNQLCTIPDGHKCSFELKTEHGAQAIYFKPPKATGNAVYLPFLPNNIATATIKADDDSITHFFTDQLSGCSIFIDSVGTSSFVIHHANYAAQSPSAEETTADPAFEKPSAVQLMKQLHASALKLYPGAKERASLFKSQYNATGRDFIQRQKDLKQKNPDFWGGTTVIGFRVGAGWQFWYQTYASTTNGGTKNIIDVQRFYP